GPRSSIGPLPAWGGGRGSGCRRAWHSPFLGIGDRRVQLRGVEPRGNTEESGREMPTNPAGDAEYSALPAGGRLLVDGDDAVLDLDVAAGVQVPEDAA